jgi:DNA polymerase-3 subunit epsilon
MDNTMSTDQSLANVEFALLDVETTGLSAAYGHRVCEVACLRVRDGETLGGFESLVDPQRAIDPGAFHVNHITPEMLAGAPGFATIAPALLALMGGAVLVAHNAPFDLSFLAAELELAGLPPVENPVVDTLALARRAYTFASNSLGAVARALDVETGRSHRAMGDVITTRNVLERILWDLDRRYGVATLDELLTFQGGSIPYRTPRVIPLPPAIAEALSAGGKVRMRYVNTQGQETDRIVRPLRVTEERGNLYLIAHCYYRGELRTFRLDRVVEMMPVD